MEPKRQTRLATKYSHENPSEASLGERLYEFSSCSVRSVGACQLWNPSINPSLRLSLPLSSTVLGALAAGCDMHGEVSNDERGQLRHRGNHQNCARASRAC